MTLLFWLDRGGVFFLRRHSTTLLALAVRTILVGYLNMRRYSIDKIAELLIKKLRG